MLVGWGVLSPISKHYGWAPGPVGDMTSGARGWILWVSLAIMCSDSLVSLVPVVAELVSFKGSRRGRPMLVDENEDGAPGGFASPGEDEDDEVETEDRLVP